MNEKRQAYEDLAAAQLDEWSAQMDLLEAKAGKAEAETKIEYQNAIESLQLKTEEAKKKLGEIKLAGDGAWESLKQGSEKVWADVKAAYHDAAAKYK